MASGSTGTLGGGAVEAEAIREATLAAASGEPALRDYALSSGVDDWGLACGGTMVVFAERLDRRASGGSGRRSRPPRAARRSRS